MTRVSRTFIDNACYHLTARGNQKQPVFHRKSDYLKYIELIVRAKRKHGLYLYAYCLMPNHVHILLEANDSRKISKFMQWLSRGYTAYYNCKYDKVGHLWQGRFYSNPILKGQYLINISTYIENNPVRAGLVDDPANYEWSSYKERCLLSERSILDVLKVDCSFV